LSPTILTAAALLVASVRALGERTHAAARRVKGGIGGGVGSLSSVRGAVCAEGNASVRLCEGGVRKTDGRLQKVSFFEYS
jgi:hypothetical protein